MHRCTFSYRQAHRDVPPSALYLSGELEPLPRAIAYKIGADEGNRTLLNLADNELNYPESYIGINCTQTNLL